MKSGERIDVLLADLELQKGESGIDLISGLRAHLTNPANVALITAKAVPAIEQQAADMQISVIGKPVDSGLLKQFLFECARNPQSYAAE